MRLVAQCLPLRQHALQPFAGRKRIERPTGGEAVQRLHQPVEVAAPRRGGGGLRTALGSPSAPRHRQPQPPAVRRGCVRAQRVGGRSVDHAHRLRDAAAPLAPVRAQAVRDAVDEVTPQPVVCPVLKRVQRVARGEQQLTRLGEFGCEPRQFAVVGEGLREVEPVHGLQRAQPAAARLQVGLLRLPRLAPQLRLAARGELLVHPGAATPHEVAKLVPEPPEQRLVTRDEPRVQQRGAGLHVFARRGDHLLESARRVPHLQAAVPQRVEHAVHHVLVGIAREQQHEVHVGVAAQLAPPVAAERDDSRAVPCDGVGELAQAGVERVAQAVGEREAGLGGRTREGAPGYCRARLHEWL